MASSSYSTPVRNYDVFLSFRGEDTRRTIVSHLYDALCRGGIFTFKDDPGIEAGDNISNRLIQVINTSWFAVVIISENYATSTWCLEELRLIMELHNGHKIHVVPIFYEVEPTNVRHQTGSFAAAFQRYEDLNTAPEMVSQWKKALNQVVQLSGFHSRTCVDEANMIAEVVGSISSQLPSMKSTALYSLHGMKAHLLKMTLRFNLECEDEFLMIGIWGMGGIGKSTIAKCLYDRFSRRFQARCFMEDIKENHKDKSPSNLQDRFLFSILGGQHIGFRADERSQKIKARLGHQKVFVVLDGVDKVEQVHALAQETSWFGPGSRIIITTRDRGLLNSCGVNNNIYEVKCFDDKDALKVFKKLAFGGRPPPSHGFEQLFIRASQLAHGLPSALVAYASHLSENTTIERWEEELRLLETSPHENVEKILRNSYDGLNNQDKTAFLHVACLLNGYPYNRVTSLLDDGRPRMNHLTAKSLINISTDGCINMHFLVEQIGRAIVRQESRDRPSRQKFLWDPNEIYDVLDNSIGTDETEGVTLHMCEMPDKLPISRSVFKVMHNLKFLKFFQHLGDAKSKVQLRLYGYGFRFPHNLRLLHWDAYPLKTLSCRFRQIHLVELDLQYSKLKILWNRTVKLRNLRRLDVTGSENLRELPDLSASKNFEELIIEGCVRLRKIPESVRRLHNLTKLNANRCDTLRDVSFSVGFDSSWGGTKSVFPNEAVQLDSLTDLSIEGAIYIKLFEVCGKAEHLSFGTTQQTPEQSMTMEQITVTPPPISEFDSSESLEIKNLNYLEIKHFSYIESRAPFLCDSFLKFPCLTQLKLINLNIEGIPNDICHLQFLETLDLGGNDIKFLPEAMKQLAKLKYLSLRNCRKLRTLPPLPQVKTLILSDCDNLVWSEEYVSPEDDRGTYCLLELWLDNCSYVGLWSSRDKLRVTKLTYLDLSRHDFMRVPVSIGQVLLSLETLLLNNCKKLISVEGLPQSLKYLYAHGCESLEYVSLPANHSIKHLDLIHCPRLNPIEHEHRMNLFINGGHSQEGSPQPCACLPETGISGDSEPSETSTKINRIGNFFRSLKSVLPFR